MNKIYKEFIRIKVIKEIDSPIRANGFEERMMTLSQFPLKSGTLLTKIIILCVHQLSQHVTRSFQMMINIFAVLA